MKAFAKISAAAALLAATIPASSQTGLGQKKTLTLDGRWRQRSLPGAGRQHISRWRQYLDRQGAHGGAL
jgi:hypothetical protein